MRKRRRSSSYLFQTALRLRNGIQIFWVIEKKRVKRGEKKFRVFLPLPKRGERKRKDSLSTRVGNQEKGKKRMADLYSRGRRKKEKEEGRKGVRRQVTFQFHCAE